MRPLNTIQTLPPASTTAGVSARQAKRDHVEATRRVSAYFRALGMTDADKVARIADVVVKRFEADHPTTHGKDLCDCAIDEARRIVRDWLLKLVELGHMPEPRPTTTGLIIWRLRKALQKYPQAFLQAEELPAGFVAEISVAAPAILPTPLPGHMEAQPFEWLSFALPTAVSEKLHRATNATHELVLNVVAGK